MDHTFCVDQVFAGSALALQTDGKLVVGGQSPAQASDGTLWAWAYGGDGELGNGTFYDSETPVAVNALPGRRQVGAIASSDFHSLALAGDGTVWAWGNGNYGQLGN